MDLYLRKVDHRQARENYRVVLKDDDDEVEIGSIGVQDGISGTHFWSWGSDTVIPMRSLESQGRRTDRADCMRRFKNAWERFAADPAKLTEFVREKRKRKA